MFELPKGFEGLQIALDEYIQDALDGEDEDVRNKTSPEERMKDFVLYLALTKGVNLLDVMNLVDIEKETNHG